MDRQDLRDEGFKALILALGICGAIVYLRDGVFSFLGVDKWQWAGSGYFESITLAATVFTLLLAFRVARLVSRTSEEDNRTFVIYRKLDLLARFLDTQQRSFNQWLSIIVGAAIALTYAALLAHKWLG